MVKGVQEVEMECEEVELVDQKVVKVNEVEVEAEDQEQVGDLDHHHHHYPPLDLAPAKKYQNL